MNAIPMDLRGIVVSGDKRGRVLGFPTANIAGPIPAMAHGVFASEIKIAGDERVWPSVTPYGTRPTFDGSLCGIIIRRQYIGHR